MKSGRRLPSSSRRLLAGGYFVAYIQALQYADGI
jgi:hypothetical protein